MIRKFLVGAGVVVLVLNSISNVLLWRDGMIQVGVNNTLGRFAARVDINTLLIARDIGLLDEKDVREGVKALGADPDEIQVESVQMQERRLRSGGN